MAESQTQRAKPTDYQLIAFDADDTLWDCQSHFDRVEQQLYRLIAPYCADPAAELYQTEAANMADLGYGCKAFTISVLETALRVGQGRIGHADLAALLHAGKQLLQLPATPLPSVSETLSQLRQRLSIPMAVFTKGELQDQENKLHRSGLLPFFDSVEITSDKGQPEFLALCRRHNIQPSQLLMVGNSLKSDIAPALAVGAWAVHIPFHVTWQLEAHADIEHPRLTKLQHFAELLDLLA